MHIERCLDLVGCSLKGFTGVCVMGFGICLVFIQSIFLMKFWYLSWPVCLIVVRHSTASSSIMSLLWSRIFSSLSSDNEFPTECISSTTGLTCRTNSFCVPRVCSWILVALFASVLLTKDDSNYEMTRTSSGPATYHRRRALGSWEIIIISPCSFKTQLFG